MNRKSKKQRRDTHHTPISTHSAIKNCPTEIWGRIFSLACVDDGFTGRSLSLVSRYIMEASRLYKYQCLAVNDYQLRPLALVFKKLPADSRRVRCLFLTQACWISQFYQRGDSGETDKNRLLKMVALTLETLEICCYLYRFPLPFQLPVLVDLTIHGTYDYNVPMTEIPVCYPALRHLRLDFFYDLSLLSILSTLIHVICAAAPALSAIRSSWSSNTGNMATWLSLKTKLKIKKLILEPHAFQYDYQIRRAGYLQHI